MYIFLGWLNLAYFPSFKNTSGSSIYFCSVYLPRSTSYVSDSYSNDIRKNCINRNSYFICGDLNSRHSLWNCQTSYRAGRILYNELNFTNFMIHHPPTLTYCPMSDLKTHSTIDLVLTNGLHDISQQVALNQFFLDHLPVLFDVYSGSV
jgi:hypothetical protein